MAVGLPNPQPRGTAPIPLTTKASERLAVVDALVLRQVLCIERAVDAAFSKFADEAVELVLFRLVQYGAQDHPGHVAPAPLTDPPAAPRPEAREGLARCRRIADADEQV